METPDYVTPNGVQVHTIHVPRLIEPPSPIEYSDTPLVKYDGSICPTCFSFCEMLRQLQHQGKLTQAIKSGISLVYNESLIGLRKTALKGCLLCKTFLGALERGETALLLGQKLHHPLPEEGTVVVHQSWLNSLDNPTRMQVSVEGHGTGHHSHVQFVSVDTELAKLVSMANGAAFFDDSDEWYLPAIAVASYWLADCRENHTLCRAYRQSDASPPTRLLEIRDNDVFLCTDPQLGTPYVALSHRWTDPAPLRLTKDSLASMKLGIEAHLLSKTFQQAVQLCRVLGIKHIWIDSLCIIQDSAEDWRAESVKMCNVYRNAAFTISAMAADPDRGLQVDRRYFSGRPVNMQVDIPDGFLECQAGTLHCRLEEQVEDYYNVYNWRFKNMGPLASRAWVLQEQLLSCRSLAFTRGEVRWECLEKECSENIPEGLRPSIVRENWAPSFDDDDSEEQDNAEEEDSKEDDSTEEDDDSVVDDGEESDDGESVGDEARSDVDKSPGPLDDKQVDAGGEAPSTDQATASKAKRSGLKMVSKKTLAKRLNRSKATSRRRTDYMQVLKRGIGQPDLLKRPIIRQEFHFAWYATVENYSRRQISFDKDRLVALAGVAEAMGGATGESFVAGLWTGTTWRDLLWQSTTYSHYMMDLGQPFGYINYTNSEFDSFEDHKLLAEHVEVTLDKYGPSPSMEHLHDQNIGGTLTLRTISRPAIVKKGSTDIFGHVSDKRVGNFYADVEIDQDELQVQCLAISEWNHVQGGVNSSGPSVWCIGVVPLPDPHRQVYTRVGLVKWERSSWKKMERVEVETFEIR